MKRLQKIKDIERLLKKGALSFHPIITLKHLPNKSADKESFYMIVVSGKVDKRAVHRNRLRRRVRDSIRSLPIAPGHQLAFLPKIAALHTKPAALRLAVQDVLSKAKLLV
jgi:ribonuclease P protein component